MIYFSSALCTFYFYNALGLLLGFYLEFSSFIMPNNSAAVVDFPLSVLYAGFCPLLTRSGASCNTGGWLLRTWAGLRQASSAVGVVCWRLGWAPAEKLDAPTFTGAAAASHLPTTRPYKCTHRTPFSPFHETILFLSGMLCDRGSIKRHEESVF